MSSSAGSEQKKLDGERARTRVEGSADLNPPEEAAVSYDAHGDNRIHMDTRLPAYQHLHSQPSMMDNSSFSSEAIHQQHIIRNQFFTHRYIPPDSSLVSNPPTTQPPPPDFANLQGSHLESLMMKTLIEQRRQELQHSLFYQQHLERAQRASLQHQQPFQPEANVHALPGALFVQFSQPSPLDIQHNQFMVSFRGPLEHEQTEARGEIHSASSVEHPVPPSSILAPDPTSSTPIGGTLNPVAGLPSPPKKSSAKKGSGSTRKPPAKKTPRKKANSSEGKPKKPLSAYNFFFHEERQRLLGELAEQSDDDVGEVNDDATERDRKHKPSAVDVSASCPPLGSQERGKKKNPHRLIGFGDLGKTIGSRWRSLTSAEREKYDRLAQKEKERYRSELEAMHRAQQESLAERREKQESSVDPETRRKYLEHWASQEKQH